MKTLKLDLECSNGPIVKSNYDISTGKVGTGIPVVDNDEELQYLDSELAYCYSCCFDYGLYDGPDDDFDDDPDGEYCVFNENAFAVMKPKLFELLAELKARLNEINDGTFEVKDLITPYFSRINRI